MNLRVNPIKAKSYAVKPEKHADEYAGWSTSFEINFKMTCVAF